jgi:hypothetical protein
MSVEHSTELKATIMKLPDDPVTWVFQNPHAASILSALADGKAHLPLEIRKQQAIAPESFRKAIHNLAGYDLVRIRSRKGSRFHGTPRGYGIEVILEVTPMGGHILEILDEFKGVLRAHETVLARATRDRWLTP